MSMAVDRWNDIHHSGIPDIFGRLVLFLKRAAKNMAHGSLRVGDGMNDEAVIRPQARTKNSRQRRHVREDLPLRTAPAGPAANTVPSTSASGSGETQRLREVPGQRGLWR
jgi:hypothetical protein